MAAKITHMLEELAKLTRTGNTDVQLARVYLSSHEWGRELISLENALTKGNLEDPGCAYRLLSEVYSKLGRKGLAQIYSCRASEC